MTKFFSDIDGSIAFVRGSKRVLFDPQRNSIELGDEMDLSKLNLTQIEKILDSIERKFQLDLELGRI